MPISTSYRNLEVCYISIKSIRASTLIGQGPPSTIDKKKVIDLFSFFLDDK